MVEGRNTRAMRSFNPRLDKKFHTPRHSSEGALKAPLVASASTVRCTDRGAYGSLHRAQNTGAVGKRQSARRV